MQTTTHLRLPADRAFALFHAEAKEHDLPVRETDDALTVYSPFGEIMVLNERKGVRLTLHAADRTNLYVLQETVDYHLDEIGVADKLQWSDAEAGAYPPNLSFATVEACDRISPSYFRVRLSGPSLERFSRDGLHFRILFQPEEHPGKWPTIAETGRTDWPGGMAAWHRPVYTTRRADPAAGTLEFDVFVHDGGRVTEWCKSALPGDEVALTGPGGEWHLEAGWVALFGDETALPAISRHLEALPAKSSGHATIMIGHEDDKQDLPRPKGVALQWLVRGGGETLLDVLVETAIPESDRFVWFAGEKSDVLAAREALTRAGLEKSEMRAAAYWVR